MDDSWRMRMGMATEQKKKPNIPRRRSVEDTSTARQASGILGPEDFSDVFGGPPRTVFSRQFQATSPNPFYEEIFRKPKTAALSRNGGRNLPEFRIPLSRERSEGFYGDIFGKEDEYRRSWSESKTESKSKSNSSSVLSSEELSPLRRAVAADDDVSFSSFASKLRPIHIPCRWNSSAILSEENQWQRIPAFSSNRSSYLDSQFTGSDNTESFITSHHGFSRRGSSPETNTASYNSLKVVMDDQLLNSPSSIVSTLCQDPQPRAQNVEDEVMQEEEEEEEDDDDDSDDHEVMSSYVIEINADNREEIVGGVSVDEAIAWAKEKFHTECSKKIWSKHEEYQYVQEAGFSGRQMDGDGTARSPMEEEQNKWILEEKTIGKDIETELLDHNLAMWSTGKEANIRLLLSTLHHILCLNSGWSPIPLANLVENSQVKKAYQRARLCLHPDKLQQRGATFTQKYIAEKAFSILQEAWAAYISDDIFYS